MGVRGELFSTKVLLQNRTYFFNVKENRLGDLYLNIVESKNRDEGGFERQSVILFAEDLQEFLKGFDESLRVLEKAVREKRRGGGTSSYEKNAPEGRRAASSERKTREAPAGQRPKRNAPPRGRGEDLKEGKRRYSSRDDRRDDDSGRGRPGRKGKDSGDPPKKRVVVKKKS